MRKNENQNRLRNNFMERQKDVNENMRRILVDWLLRVHYNFKLSAETFFLAVSITDRYLSKVQAHKLNLQLIGVTALLIASKYEDIYAIEIKSIVLICNKTYKREEILDMELSILITLDF